MTTALVGVAFLVGLLTLAALVLLGRDRVSDALWRYRNPPEKLASEHEALVRRIQSPDWAFYAEHLQREVPKALLSWFSDGAAVSRYYYFEGAYVAFSPIDRRAFEEEWVQPGVMAIAHSDGDPYFLRPGIDATDAVFISFHDGGGTEEVAPSVEAFLGGLRVAA